MNSASGSRFPGLHDPDWSYWNESNRAIAEMLNCSSETVRLARLRIGAPARPRGRPRVVAKFPVIVAGSKPDCPPSEALLAERIRAAQEAKTAGDKLAYEDAMLGVSAIAGRIVEHSRMLRRAA